MSAVATPQTRSLHKVPLKDTVLAVLSLASLRGSSEIKITDFYRAFADTANEYNELLPPLVFTRTANTAYSKRLDDALSSSIGYSLDLPNPRLQRTSMRKEVAKRHLAWLTAKYGQDYVTRAQQLTDAVLAKIGK